MKRALGTILEKIAPRLNFRLDTYFDLCYNGGRRSDNSKFWNEVNKMEVEDINVREEETVSFEEAFIHYFEQKKSKGKIVDEQDGKDEVKQEVCWEDIFYLD
jgi:hypothetical protein